MKKLIVMFCILFMFCITCSANAESLTLVYDGEQTEYSGALYTLVVNDDVLQTPLPPIIFNDRALVPIREVFEALGATVSYTSETQRIDIKSNSVSIRMNINSSEAYVNGKNVTIPDNITPKLIGRVGESAKTMVPIRFISETMGMDVNFNGDAGIISVNSSSQTASKAISITDVRYKSSNSYTLITVEASNEIGDFTKSTATDPERLIIDIKNAGISTPNNSYDINLGQVSKVRLGTHETYARVVVDMQKISDYSVNLSSDKRNLIIKIASDGLQPSVSPSSTPTPTPSASTTNGEKIVVIDAGHGGDAPGALGVYNGVTYNEKDINLAIAQKVQTILTQKGISVIMTRSGDTSLGLPERSDVANQNNASMFVSIHSNSIDGSTEPNGTEAYYTETNNDGDNGLTSKQLAETVLSSMISHMGTNNRGVKTANYVVTKTCTMPAILVEVGFVSNSEELGKMIDDAFQQKVAEGIAEGIINSLGSIT